MKDTAEQILDIAQDLVRCRGYSAFSYADISEQIGIRKASIHYHFSSKEDLARALVRRYRDAFRQTLQQIERLTSDPQSQLTQFFHLYQGGLNQNQLCLCGMLSSELTVLPETVKHEIQFFFSETQSWLAAVLRRGCEAGIFSSQLSPVNAAALLLATLQGAQLLARASNDHETTFEQIVEQLLATLMKSH